MELQQVFTQYDNKNSRHKLNFEFCPHCGKEMEFIKKNDTVRNTCPNCGFIQYINPLPGVSILIVNDNHVLLGKRSSSFGTGQWCLPGGFIEHHENFLAAAHREVFEETGLRIKLRSIINVTTNFLTPELHTLAIILLAEALEGETDAGDDISEVKWFPLSGPFPEMAFEADIHIIERYNKTRLSGVPVDPGLEMQEPEIQ